MMAPEETLKPLSPKERWDSAEEPLLYLRSLAAYVFAQKYASAVSLLEIGCGTGYGADHLSRFSNDVVAIDIWKEGISNCHAKYKRENLTFMLADGLKLPFRDCSFDAAVSFQVIEHIDPRQCSRYLSEAKRVLKGKGALVLTTPNSKLRLLPFQKTWNPQHRKEYDCEGLGKVLTKVFDQVELYGLEGTEEIQSIERNRVRQSPVLIYTTLPLTLIMDRLPSLRVFSKLKKAVVDLYKSRRIINRFQTRTFVEKFSVNDFKVNSNCTKNCIDIYAVCYNAGGQMSDR